MRKRAIVLLLIVVMAVSAFSLTGCGDEEPLTIVYLGDSIAEAVIGPSPLSERENYGYYGIVGMRNDYKFYNRSVSGHQTKQMLEYIQREDDGATRTNSLIKTADIIHVSILGNDLLQNDLGAMVVSIAKKEKNGDTSGMGEINGHIAAAAVNFAAIVEKLNEMNPTAVIMIQTVYNPVYKDSTLIDAEARAELLEIGYSTEDDFRFLGSKMLELLNGVAIDYHTAHPDSFELLDVYAAFQAVHDEDATRGQNLIYNDWVHPSNEGHAVIADVIQAKLEELDLAQKRSAVKQYKEIRIDQIERMFSDSIDVKKATALINKGKTCADVTKTYFEIIKDKTPVYANVKADAVQVEGARFVETEEKYALDADCSVMNLPVMLLLDESKCGITLRTDGTMTMKITLSEGVLAAAGSLLDGDLNDMVRGFDVEGSGFLEMYVNPLVPGFTLDDIEGSLKLLDQSIGIKLTGIDFDSDNIKSLAKSLADTGCVSDDFSIPDGIGLEYNGRYYIKEVYNADGQPELGVFIGKHNPDGEGFAVATISEVYNSEEGKVEQKFRLRVEFIQIDVNATLVTE